MGITHFGTFLITGLLLNLTPGNDTIFILSRSIAQGRKAGLISVLGISTGLLVHTLLAAFGLTIIIAESMFLYTFIKYAGAAYLAYMGTKMLLAKSQPDLAARQALPQQAPGKIYRDGVITNVLNPKVAMFFIAFLPQFIEPGYKNNVLPLLTLGIVFTTTATLWTMIVAYFASGFSERLRTNQQVAVYINKACGLVLVALGIKIALSNHAEM